MNDFLGGEFGKVKEYAEHIRKTIGDVNGKSAHLLSRSVLLFDTCVLGPACRSLSLCGHAPPKMEFNWLQILMRNF